MITAATVSVCALLIFVGNLVLGINQIAKQEFEKLEQRIELTVNLRDNTDPLILQEIIAFLERDARVKSVQYISKEEAIQNLLETLPETREAFRAYDIKNPLPSSLTIVTHDPNTHQKLMENLMETPFGKFIILLPEQETETARIADSFITLVASTKRILLALTIIFIASAILIIENAIHLTMFYRRREIEVMRLVGATPMAIRIPFIIEGAVLGVCAWIIMIVLFGLFAIIGGHTFVTAFEQNPAIYIKILAIEFILAVTLGIASSLIALERYSNKANTI